MSPFFGVSAEKETQLTARMAALGVKESDLEERFIRGSGAGGQKVNKTSSCVALKHRPTGLEVRCQAERSQVLNRFFARRELCDRIEQKVLGEKSARQQEHEKVRRQKRRRSRRQKAHVLHDKRCHADKKRGRATPGREE